MFSCFKPSTREPDAAVEKEAPRQLDSNETEREERRTLKEKLKAAKREARDAEQTVESLHVELEELREQLKLSKERDARPALPPVPGSPSSDISEVRKEREGGPYETPMHTPLSLTPAGTPMRQGAYPTGATQQQLDQNEQTLQQIQKAAMEKQQVLEAQVQKAHALIGDLTRDRDEARTELQESLVAVAAASASAKAVHDQRLQDAEAKMLDLRSKLNDKETDLESFKSLQLQREKEAKEVTPPIVLRVAVSDNFPGDQGTTAAAEEMAMAQAQTISDLTLELKAAKGLHEETSSKATALSLQLEAVQLEAVQLGAEVSGLRSKNEDLDLVNSELNSKIITMAAKHDELHAAHVALDVSYLSCQPECHLSCHASHVTLDVNCLMALSCHS